MRRLIVTAAVLAVAAVSSAQAATSPEAVARAWSRALNANDNERAAWLFAPNARVIQPGVDVRLTTHKLAVAFNNALPCAGRITTITVNGERATATFILGTRPKHLCGGLGQKAAALFFVHNGKIVRWQQVVVPQGPTAS